MAESSRVVESMDSLWFFSNIVLSTTQLPNSVSNEINTPKHVNLSFEKESSKPTSQIFQKHPNKSQNAKITSDSRCPKCGEFSASEGEQEMLNLVDMEVVEEIKRRRRKIKSLKSRRNIIGEFDLCFILKEVSTEPWMYEKNCGYSQRCDRNDAYKNVFPLNDNAAMKEHLKSWAYVVASTVR